MVSNRSVPVDTVLLHVVYRDLLNAIGWLIRVFGFAEHYRYGNPISGAQVFLGRAFVMLHQPAADSSSAQRFFGPQSLTIFIEDVEQHCAKAKTEGAVVLEEPRETVYGEFQYDAEDCEGNRWLFSRHARDLSPADWGATIVTVPKHTNEESPH